jgi:hypothetical protein
LQLGELRQPQRVGACTSGASVSMSDFMICINNDSNPASLILGKVYRTLPDAEAESHNLLRVIDEDKSEPDSYLYPASMFAPVELQEATERVLMTASG